MAAVKLKAGSKKAQDLICAAIKKCAPRKAGEGTYSMERMDKVLLPKIQYVLTTGIEAFDDLVGGFPFGRICEVFGIESSGKTNLVVRSAIRTQVGFIHEIVGREHGNPILRRLDPSEYDASVVYIDNEQSLDDDKIYCDAEDNGELTRLSCDVGDCDTVDMFFKIAEITIDTCAKIQEDTGRLQFVLLICDTVAATSSRDELTREWGKRDFPRHAADWREGFRTLTRKIRRGNVCVLCTNQVSDNFKEQAKKGRPTSNQPRPEDFSTFGGKALKFYSTHRVFLFNTGARWKLAKENQFPDGFHIGFVSVKNRIRKPLREGRMVLMFATDDDGFNGGLNNLYSKLESLVYLKHAERSEAGEISFKFDAYDISTKTFSAKAASLDEQDAAPSPKRGGKGIKNPVIKNRGEWPQFYADHKEDLDALWASAIKTAFITESQSTTPIIDVDTEGEDTPATEELIEQE